MAAFSRTQIIPIRDVTDADANHRPKPGWTLVDPPHLWLEKLAHAWLAHQGRPINPNLRYYLNRLPAGYAVFERARLSKGSSSATDKHLYGHPKHKFFDSPNRFAPHFVHLMQHGNNDACPCTLCNPPSVVNTRRIPIISLPFIPPTSTHRNVNPVPPDNNEKLPDQSKSGAKKLPIAAKPDPSPEDRSAEPVQQSSNDQPQPRLHRRLPAAVLRTRDDEDIPDTVRWLIDRLKQEGRSIDEPIQEPLSMDWRAEHELLSQDIADITKQHAWVPRKAEIVLFVRSIDGEICFDNVSKTYKIFDEKSRRFTGYPKWEAGVVGQTARETLTLQDILMETHETRINPVDSGFRIEPIPDPNDFANKAWTKRYKYVPLHHIRPMAFWQIYTAGIPEEQRHITISHALKCMSSFALVGRHRFKGTWPTASVYHKAIQIGAEFMSVGDAIRILPQEDIKRTKEDNSSQDILVLRIMSIRLNFSELDNASIDDYDSGRPYKSKVQIVGKAYTLNPEYAYDRSCEPANSALLPPGMQGYDTWRLAHAPDKVLGVPVARVAGRCIEAEAMLLWHPGSTPLAPSRAPSLSIGLPDVEAARAYATEHDARIDRVAQKNWFWADTRAELLGITTLNGIAVDAWAGLRGQDVLDEQRHALNVLEKGAGRAERLRLTETQQRKGGDTAVRMRSLAGGRMGVKAAAATAAAAADQGDTGRANDESDGEGYVVERLLQKQTLDDGTEVYEVQWQGWEETTWEPATVIAIDAPDTVRRFEKALKKKQQQQSQPATPRPGRSSTSTSQPAEDKNKEDNNEDEDEDEDEEEAYVVQAIRSKRKDPDTDTTEYEVKWQGWPTTTWEPATQLLEDAPQLVRRFERRLAALQSKASNGHRSTPSLQTTFPRRMKKEQPETVEIADSSSDDADAKRQSMLAAFERGAAVRAAAAASASRGSSLPSADLAHRGKRKRGTVGVESSDRGDAGQARRQRVKTTSEDDVVWIDGAGEERGPADGEHDGGDDSLEDASNALDDWESRSGPVETKSRVEVPKESSDGSSEEVDFDEDEPDGGISKSKRTVKAAPPAQKKPGLLSGWLRR